MEYLSDVISHPADLELKDDKKQYVSILYNNKSTRGYIEEIFQILTIYSDSEWQAAQCRWITIESNSDVNLSHIKE